jgi:molybdopterin-guanine dinucleotide biosynthesis protein A
LEPIEAMLTKGVNQIDYLFESIDVHYIEGSKIDYFNPQRLSFFNINTRSDMAMAREMARN